MLFFLFSTGTRDIETILEKINRAEEEITKDRKARETGKRSE